MKKAIDKIGRDRKSGKVVAGYRVLGTTKDGVHILEPRYSATHFKRKELRKAIAAMRVGRDAE